MSSASSAQKWPYLVLLCVALVGGTIWFVANRPPPERVYTIGLVTWIGYGPFFVADELGYFEAENIPLKLEIMDGHGLREAAYQAGELDFFPNTPDAFVILFSEHGPSGKIVSALDESRGGDGIIAKQGIGSIADLKGRTVGFQDGITSHFLLLYALKKAGLSGNDVRQENLSAGEAGAAFMAGKLEAAVTWEPWLTKARQAPESRVLATSADYNGLIVDVLLASKTVLRDEPEAVGRLMRAWYRALDYMKEYPKEARKIISRHLNDSPESIDEMLKTVKFFTPAESKAYLRGQLRVVAEEASSLYLENKVTRREFDLSEVIDESATGGE